MASTIERVARRVQGKARQIMHLRRQPAAITEYLASVDAPKLHLGCGESVLDGWLNADIAPSSPEVVYIDATATMPFEDSTFDYIFSENLVEHISYEQGRAMLAEVARILRPGGRLRITTGPSLDALVSLFGNGANGTGWYVDAYRERHLAKLSWADESFVINHAMRAWGHQFLYSQKTLHRLVVESGFSDVVDAEPYVSDDPLLNDLEMHGNVVGVRATAFESICVEATNPQ